jgi:hypothetical protein
VNHYVCFAYWAEIISAYVCVFLLLSVVQLLVVLLSQYICQEVIGYPVGLGAGIEHNADFYLLVILRSNLHVPSRKILLFDQLSTSREAEIISHVTGIIGIVLFIVLLSTSLSVPV